MPKMKIAVIPRPGADFEVQEREVPQPPAGHVHIRVDACGICFSDHLSKDNLWPGLVYPLAPGHEVAGVIDEVGAGVIDWKKSQRVGVGWHGGQDGTRLSRRRGDFGNCSGLKITGFHYDGGYAEYMLAPVAALAHMPDSLDPAEAAPVLCRALRHPPNDRKISTRQSEPGLRTHDERQSPVPRRPDHVVERASVREGLLALRLVAGLPGRCTFG
jgi:D-arabinose 1-dehydrogenase-like Zn-dependent alcohol dehydrogenase